MRGLVIARTSVRFKYYEYGTKINQKHNTHTHTRAHVERVD